MTYAHNALECRLGVSSAVSVSTRTKSILRTTTLAKFDPTMRWAATVLLPRRQSA